METTNNKKTTDCSHAMLFSIRELIWTLGIVALVILYVLPEGIKKLERPVIENDFRLSYSLRDDYYLYSVISEKFCETHDNVFLGDSVIWGMYSDNENTLTALMNQKLGDDVYANLAVDGLHYVALENLLMFYGDAISEKNVFLYFNPLWLNSRLYDLSDTEEFGINHPRLLPQFAWNMPSYKASLAKRMSATLEHHIPFYSWMNHLQVCFLDNNDLKSFTIENSSENPFARMSLHCDCIECEHENGKENWMQAKLPTQDWKWVPASESRQYAAFLRIVEMLQNRGNEVNVVLGTVNPYIQTPESLKEYRKLHADLVARFEEMNIRTLCLPELPSEEYADASHPLPHGYSILADYVISVLN